MADRTHRCVHGSPLDEGACTCARAHALPQAATEGALLEGLLDALPFYVMLIDESHTVLYANHATRDALGLAPEEIVGSYCPAAVHGLDQPYPHCPLEEAGGRHIKIEREYCDPDAGGWLSSAVYPAPLRSREGKTIYAHVVRSIDQRKKAEHALHERVAVETLVAGVTTRLLSAPSQSLQAELERTLATVAEFMGCTAAALYLLDEAGERAPREVAWSASGGPSPLAEQLPPAWLDDTLSVDAGRLDEVTGLDGVAAAVAPLSLDGRSVGLGVFVGGDGPTPRLRDQRLLELLGNTFSAVCYRLRNVRQQQRYATQLRSLATMLGAAEERERRHLAADLHDSIGQTLALCIMNLSNLEHEGLPAEAEQVVADTRAHIEDALVGAKTLMFDLSPPSLHDIGIVGALEGLLERLGPRYDLEWDLRHDGAPLPLAEDQRAFVFRAVQELVTNVSKHAQATRVEVSLSRAGEQVTVEVKDDGVGMNGVDPFSVVGPVPGFGLFSIRERLNHFGGDLGVDSAEPGTRITLTMPLELEGVVAGDG